MTISENYLKIFDNLTCKNVSYSKSLIEATCKSTTDPLLQKFAEKFFAYLPIDYISKNKNEIFIELARDTYKFFQKRKNGEKKIEITSHDNNGKPFVSIKLINTDKPFIIDSLKCLFARINTNIKFLFHPVLCVNRDKEGKLLSIEDNCDSKESLVSIIIYTKSYDENFINYLKNEIISLLNKVESTYESWPEFLKKADDLSKAMASEKQIHDFLEWLRADNFTFLGYTKFGKNGKLEESIGDAQICAAAEIVYGLAGESNIDLGQVNRLSPVHKNSFMDYAKIIFGDNVHIFLGLYSSDIYYTSVQNIPVLKEKLSDLLKMSEFPVSGHNYKNLKAIVEALPREALFSMQTDQLYCIATHILSAMATSSIRVFANPNHSGEFINILVFLPRQRLSPDIHSTINKYLSEKLKAHIVSDYITEIHQNFCYLYVTFSIEDINALAIDVSEIESDIDTISAYWPDSVNKLLVKTYDEYHARALSEYVDIFPKNYQYESTAEDALSDISYLEKLGSDSRILFNLKTLSAKSHSLKIYTSIKRDLSSIMPLIENLGFKAIDEEVFELNTKDNTKIWIYKFDLEAENLPENLEEKTLKQNAEEALRKMEEGTLHMDALCKLVALAGFNWRNVMIVRGLCLYLHQTGFQYGKEYVSQTLVKHYNYTSKLLELFEYRFNPQKVSTKSEIEAAINTYLSSVTSSAEDKVLRSIFGVIMAILRTNCYQKPEDGEFKNYISFKFDSSKVPWLPLPIPYAEIFVYSSDFEGIHLRGGRVARGGLRWSDRGEDYRTEVLGLMKAQMTKNAVIVPVGSKGGFFVRLSPDKMTREEYMKRVVECYKNFLRGLLDITDNIVNGETTSPKDTILLDDKDPYLVVAADKGTATFSDYANSISAEYNFWLGDAFASGGSAGYDHKKMAITAKGGWISVTNHFATMGIDVQKDHITVLGIGDMSGDVFGNGMLLSSSIKLVAAFNHMHIFLDPTPDPKESFRERKRLFEMPGSKWSDYDPNIMSKGARVFERSAKTLELTDEIKELVGITTNTIEPDALINALLKMKVDLLWNGGIGTYIKASTENHLDIGDKSNDNLRCNGRDVGAKVIGEGGNLGVSQLGRIEFSKNGGKINTDFIDNSAGVDCSDHEVNIKIAMRQAIASGKLTLEKRNQLLGDMTNEVAELVLEDNFKQTQAITIMEKSEAFNTEMFGRFISEVEKTSLLDRAVEFLPADSEISRRIASGEKMTRPELSVLLSYSKMMIYNDLFNSKIADDSYFESYLINYFPSSMREKFEKEIKSHPLRKEIILTVVTNKMVNFISGPIINYLQKETGAPICDITRAYAIICEIFGIDVLWEEISATKNVSSDAKILAFSDLILGARKGISWLVRNSAHHINIKESIDYYRSCAISIISSMEDLLSGQSKNKLKSKIERYVNAGIKDEIAEKISALDYITSAFDIIMTSKKTSLNNEEVARGYFKIGEKFSIDWLKKCCDNILGQSYWNRLSVYSIKDDLYDKQRRLLQKVIESSKGRIELSEWVKNHNGYAEDFINFVDDLRLQENIDINMIIVANKKFEMFLRKV
ncbi:MAG: NAD-glutamate dehydrogenase [Rickettsiaceae bacterium]|nr:NAD-glutamate dehydrogenase [Rickettsiaceae bacterium]